MQFIHLKHAIQWFLEYSQGRATIITVNFWTFHSGYSKKKPNAH